MKDLLARLQDLAASVRLLLSMQRVVIQSASPLTVKLRDGSVVRAVKVTGLTYTPGTAAVALTADRVQPLVFPTA